LAIQTNKSDVMKNKILLIAAVFSTAVTFGQDLTSKKGEVILPEAGDWAVGFEASPFLNYAGNLFNSGNTSPVANFLDTGMTIYGKYFVDEQTAYRVRLRLGFGTTTTTSLVPDLAATAAPGDEVEDEVKAGYNNFTIGVGMEKRKGSTRLQGFYGGEFMVSLIGNKTEFSYGNEIQNQGTRVTEIKGRPGFGVGLRGFIGVEYFIFPKISVAAEYGWGVALKSLGEGETVTATWNGTAEEKVTTKTGTQSSFGIDTDNNNGSLRMMFHF
jgi:hypothetical protein